MQEKLKIGEILVRTGLIAETQLRAALGEQARWGGRLGVTLVKLGFLAEEDLTRALGSHFGIPVVRLQGKRVSPEVLALLPSEFAEKHGCMPLFLHWENGMEVLYLGMEDPGDLAVLDDVAFRSGLRVRPVLVGPVQIREAIAEFYHGEEAILEVAPEAVEPTVAAETSPTPIEPAAAAAAPPQVEAPEPVVSMPAPEPVAPVAAPEPAAPVVAAQPFVSEAPTLGAEPPALAPEVDADLPADPAFAGETLVQAHDTAPTLEAPAPPAAPPAELAPAAPVDANDFSEVEEPDQSFEQTFEQTFEPEGEDGFPELEVEGIEAPPVAEPPASELIELDEARGAFGEADDLASSLTDFVNAGDASSEPEVVPPAEEIFPPEAVASEPVAPAAVAPAPPQAAETDDRDELSAASLEPPAETPVDPNRSTRRGPVPQAPAEDTEDVESSAAEERAAVSTREILRAVTELMIDAGIFTREDLMAQVKAVRGESRSDD